MKDSSRIDELRDILSKEKKNPFSKYPDQAIYALENKELVKTLESHFGTNQVLNGIKYLGYNISTGLIHICFEFSQQALKLSPDSVLVMMDSECKVVAIVDHFNQEQPNRFWPVIPESMSKNLPFVLAFPSITDSLLFGDDELEDFRKQTAEYMRTANLQDLKQPCREDKQTTSYVRTVFETYKRYCEEYTRGRCDRWVTEVTPDNGVDYKIDDCNPEKPEN